MFAIASTNSGSSWKKTLLTSAMPDAWAPMTGISGNTMYVAWRTYPGGSASQEYISISTNGGASWSSPRAIGFVGHDNEWPFTVSVSGSYAYVMWDYNSGSGIRKAACAYSSDSGTTWSSPVNLSTSTSQAVPENDIATGGSAITGSTFYAVWQNPSGQIDFVMGSA